MSIVKKLFKLANDQKNFLKEKKEHDQNERKEYLDFINSNNGYNDDIPKQYAQLKNRKEDDLFNESENLNMVKNYNFNFDKFDEDDWENYFILIQHSDNHPELQLKSLKILEKYLTKEDIKYKYLYDRVYGRTTGQIYGTQHPDFTKINYKSPYLNEMKNRIKELYNIEILK